MFPEWTIDRDTAKYLHASVRLIHPTIHNGTPTMYIHGREEREVSAHVVVQQARNIQFWSVLVPGMALADEMTGRTVVVADGAQRNNLAHVRKQV